MLSMLRLLTRSRWELEESTEVLSEPPMAVVRAGRVAQRLAHVLF